MFNVKDSDFFEADEDAFDTVLASDISFSGDIRFVKPFMIKGRVNGRIDAQSDLVIDTEASVTADIVAERVLVRGSVEGNIEGKTLVFVTESGSVIGDISSAQVVLEPGSTFCGRCTMTK